MSAPFSKNPQTEHAIHLENLPLDLRRVLSIQFREFIHHIEDSQTENLMEHSPGVIGFLERCYGDRPKAA